jgi:hypothetical protein
MGAPLAKAPKVLKAPIPRFTGPLGVKNVEHEPLLFEKAGILAQF